MKGGKRPGAGRPKGEPTTTITIRVKQSEAEEFKNWIMIKRQRKSKRKLTQNEEAAPIK